LDFGNVKAPNATSGFCEVRVAPSLYVCVVFCRSLFVLSSVFFWPLYCLSFHPFSFGHCIVCPFIRFVLAIVLFVLSSVLFWPLYCLSFHPFCFGHFIVCPFILFLLAIVLFVFRRFTASYYSFGIF